MDYFVCRKNPIFAACFASKFIFSSPEQKAQLIVYQCSGVHPSVVHPSAFTISKIFFSKTAWPIKLKFYVEPPWVGGMKVCSRELDHLTKMAAAPIYGKNPSKNFLLQNRLADFHETWYVASGNPPHHSLLK